MMAEQGLAILTFNEKIFIISDMTVKMFLSIWLQQGIEKTVNFSFEYFSLSLWISLFKILRRFNGIYSAG